MGGIHRTVVGLAYHSERALRGARRGHRHRVLGGQCLEYRFYRKVFLHCYGRGVVGNGGSSYFEVLETVSR